MIYIASPYSHPNPLVRQARFDAACRATAQLIRAGNVVFSPIVHGHPLVRFGLPTDWAFWQRHDQELLRRCGEMIVLRLDGWGESVGIQGELAFADGLAKPIRFINAED